MHPILANRRRLVLYLLAWLPIGAILVIGLTPVSDWPAAALFFFPFTLIYAFIELSAWYICRAFPLEPASAAVRAVGVHFVAAMLASLIWMAIGFGWAAVLDGVDTYLDVRWLYAQQQWVLFVIGALLFWLAGALHYVFIALQTSRRAQLRALELSLLARETELKALRAQIDPHFLFNSLNSISALTATDPLAARRMCLLLADFLRETLRLDGDSQVLLAEELELAERFLAIEHVRLGPRLAVVRDIDPAALECYIPALLLQPLLENAILHGVSQRLEGGTITVAAARQGLLLCVVVENPCDPDRPRNRGAGVGLELMQKRIAVKFGSQASLRIQQQPERFRVELRIPIRSHPGTA